MLLLLMVALPAAAQDSSEQTPPEPAASEQAASEAAGDAPEEPADAELAERLRQVFGEVEVFEKLEVSVRHGVVKLGGSVPTPSARAGAIELAGSFPGVLYVEALAEIPPPPEVGDEIETDARPGLPTPEDERIAERLRAILARVGDLGEVQIEVASGVVHLRGETASPRAQKKAEELAASLEGVVFVDNDIVETLSLDRRLVPNVEKIYSFARSALFMLPLFLVAVLVLWLFWRLGRVVQGADGMFAKLTENKLVQGLLKQLGRTVVVLLGIYLALEILGATTLVGAVLGTAGVVGLALGFAFRDIAENYLASIILSVRRPFVSKDFVEIDGKSGTVIRMTTRETVLMTADGNHLTLPNAAVFKTNILNYSRNPLRRFDVLVGVGTDVDLNVASRLGIQVLEGMPGVVDEPPPVARIESLGDSNVGLRFYGWVDQREADYLKVRSESVRRIKSSMDENEIDMPVPTQEILLRRPSDKRRPAPQEAHDPNVDVSPENEIDRQVERDLAESGEEDLLKEEAE